MARYIASEDLERALSPVLEWAANVVGPGAEEASSDAYLVAALDGLDRSS